MTKLIPAFALVLLATMPAAAQDAPRPADSRWAPYVGCWKIVQESLGQQPVPLAPGTTICARPSGPGTITVTTTVDGKNVLEQTIVADGTPQKVSQGDCTGTQTSTWSRDGERLFTKADITCTGRPPRSVSGITLITKGHWIDAQATVVDGTSDVRVRRYQRTDHEGTNARAESAQPVVGMAGRPMNVEDIIEASAKVQSEALEAALDEAGGQFTLNSRTLRQLADNGVAPNVIDLMVAQAYPSKFRVERGMYPPGYSASASTATISAGAPYPFAYDPYYYNSFYYSPFAYPYYWGSAYGVGYGYPYYYNYYGYRPYNIWSGGGWIGTGSSGGGTAQPGGGDSSGSGVVVNGRGYTRVGPNTPDSGDAAAPSGSRTRSGTGVRGIDSSDSSSSSGSSTSSSGSSGGSVSGGGYSGGGGGGGERTAQPR